MDKELYEKLCKIYGKEKTRESFKQFYPTCSPEQKHGMRIWIERMAKQSNGYGDKDCSFIEISKFEIENTEINGDYVTKLTVYGYIHNKGKKISYSFDRPVSEVIKNFPEQKETRAQGNMLRQDLGTLNSLIASQQADDTKPEPKNSIVYFDPDEAIIFIKNKLSSELLEESNNRDKSYRHYYFQGKPISVKFIKSLDDGKKEYYVNSPWIVNGLYAYPDLIDKNIIITPKEKNVTTQRVNDSRSIKQSNIFLPFEGLRKLDETKLFEELRSIDGGGISPSLNVKQGLSILNDEKKLSKRLSKPKEIIKPYTADELCKIITQYFENDIYCQMDFEKTPKDEIKRIQQTLKNEGYQIKGDGLFKRCGETENAMYKYGVKHKAQGCVVPIAYEDINVAKRLLDSLTYSKIDNVEVTSQRAPFKKGISIA